MFDTAQKVFYASKTIRKYTTAEDKFLYVAASYDANGKLIAVKTDAKTVNTIGSVYFNIEIPTGASLSDGSYVKAMLLQGDTMTPYTSAYIYDEIHGKSYSGITPVSNY